MKYGKQAEIKNNFRTLHGIRIFVNSSRSSDFVSFFSLSLFGETFNEQISANISQRLTRTRMRSKRQVINDSIQYSTFYVQISDRSRFE